jgi:two-component system response regulator YesN
LYNLLIVDDEVVVVNGLAYDIEWEDLKISGVFKAYNAKQALNYMNKNRIDIVIADIKMPGMDGLEMANYIRAKWPYVKIILLSGYEEFKYAQKAILIGVYHFLTKPAAYNEIKETVKNALIQREKELSQIHALEDAERQLEAAIPMIQERYLNAWVVQGRMTPEKVIRSACKLQLDTGYLSALLLFKIDEWSKQPTPEQQDVYELAIKNSIRKILLKDANGYIFNDIEGNCILIIFDKDENCLKEKLHYIKEMLETFQNYIDNLLGCTISIYWSDVVTLQETHTSYSRLLEISNRHLVWPSGIIMGPETMKSDQKNEDNIDSLYIYPRISTLVESAQKDKVIERIEVIFSEVQKRGSISHETLLSIYYSIVGSIMQDCAKRGISTQSWAQDYQKYFYSFQHIKTIYDLKNICIKLTELYMDYIVSYQNDNVHYLIEKTKKIIEESIGKELSLIDIASNLYIHPNYLSRLFKAQVGLSITDYSIKLRMEKAKKILQQSNAKMYEVAEMVGYASAAHFNRTFKKYFGVTPKEYQKFSPL